MYRGDSVSSIYAIPPIDKFTYKNVLVKSTVSSTNDFAMQTATYEIPAQNKRISHFPLRVSSTAAGDIGGVIWLYFGTVFDAAQNKTGEKQFLGLGWLYDNNQMPLAVFPINLEPVFK